MISQNGGIGIQNNFASVREPDINYYFYPCSYFTTKITKVCREREMVPCCMQRKMADGCGFIFRKLFEFYLGPGFQVPPSSQPSPLPRKILVFTFTRVHGCCMELSYNYSNSELGFCEQYFSPRSTYFMSSQMLLPFQHGNLAGPAYHII